MQWYEIEEFSKEVKELREFLAEIAVRKDEIDIVGPRLIVNMNGFEAVEKILADFPVKLMKIMESARFIEKSLAERFRELVKETKMEDAIANIRIQFDLAKRQRIASSMIRFLRSLAKLIKTDFDYSMQFNDESISINKIIASLLRVESLLTSLHTVAWERIRGDDEIFKPSNVETDFIYEQIEAAVQEIENSEKLGKAEKARLIIYLKETKLELSKDPPSWKKIVGALIIISAILSGISDAPKAIENVNSAIKHILGTAVERQIPNLLPPPKEDQMKINDAPELFNM